MELLDYCRVKKIFEKGFGFLSSLYYEDNVFFHFNYVKDTAAKEKLEKLKRGEVYFYYTSKPSRQRRRVDKLWLNISDVDKHLIPVFVDRIVDEFVSGKTNPFEVAYVIKDLRENGYLNKDEFEKLLNSPKLQKTPSILKAMLTGEELKKISAFEELIELRELNKIDEKEWIKKIISAVL